MKLVFASSKSGCDDPHTDVRCEILIAARQRQGKGEPPAELEWIDVSKLGSFQSTTVLDAFLSGLHAHIAQLPHRYRRPCTCTQPTSSSLRRPTC